MDYEVDFRGIIPEQEAKGLKKFMIGIEGIYGWGTGYYSQELMELFDKFCETISYNLDELISDNVIYVEGGNSECSTIKGKKEYNKSYVYLHPMEFTGYLKEEDINNLCNYINSYFRDNENISASIRYMNDTVSISDEKYTELIYEHSKEILEKINKYYAKLSPKAKERFINGGWREMGWDFARSARIARTGDNSGMSSSDTDICAVNNMVKMAIDNGLIG